MPLRDLITDAPESFLSNAVFQRFPGTDGLPQLPFLFKVLSFDKALPLQAHPDKSLAEKLMRQEHVKEGKNEQFVDPNHKPEVAIALSDDFSAFVGFRPVQEIQSFIKHVPELQELVGKETAKEYENLNSQELERRLKTLFGKIFQAEKPEVKRLTEQLVKRVSREGDIALGPLGSRDKLGTVVQAVFDQYPHDAGLFAAVFFMNLIRLKRGEGISVPADCIHAYLTGDCIECMANSDNMVSCGFQGEMGPPDDASLFVKMLLNNPGPSKQSLLKSVLSSKSANGYSVKYETIMREFNILKINLPPFKQESLKLLGPAIYLATEGAVEISTQAQDAMFVESLKTGQSAFVKPGFEVKLTNKSTSDEAELYAAYCEVENT